MAACTDRGGQSSAQRGMSSARRRPSLSVPGTEQLVVIRSDREGIVMDLAHSRHDKQDPRTPGVLIGQGRGHEIFSAVFFAGRRRRVFAGLAVASGARPPDRVLDVGCGTGYFTRVLAEAVAPGGAAPRRGSVRCGARACAASHPPGQLHVLRRDRRGPRCAGRLIRRRREQPDDPPPARNTASQRQSARCSACCVPAARFSSPNSGLRRAESAAA